VASYRLRRNGGSGRSDSSDLVFGNKKKRVLIKKEGVYLRFLKILYPSKSVTYSKPFSIRLVASWIVLAVLQWYSSFRKASKSWVYRRVVLRSLCPSRVFTCKRSLVFWYSIVALKCLKSYRRICRIVGSWSFSLSLLRIRL